MGHRSVNGRLAHAAVARVNNQQLLKKLLGLPHLVVGNRTSVVSLRRWATATHKKHLKSQ